MVVTNVG